MLDEARVSFLRRMISSPSPSGFEQPVQQVIREEIAHLKILMRLQRC